MNTSPRLNPLAKSIHVATVESGMALENSQSAKLVRELVKIIGLSILGAGIGWVIGSALESMFNSGRKARNLEDKYGNLKGLMQGETKIDRSKLVGSLAATNATINYLLQDCINEGKLYAAASGLIQNKSFYFSEKLNVMQATVEADKLYKACDERTFVNNAERLCKDLAGSVVFILSEINDINKALKEYGKGVDLPVYRVNAESTEEELRHVAEKIGEVVSAFIDLASTDSGMEKLSISGSFDVRGQIDNAEKVLANIDKEEDAVQKSYVEIQRASIDQDRVKEFVKSTPEIAAANARMLALIKIMAVADKGRGNIRSAVLHTMNLMAGALKRNLDPKYKGDGQHLIMGTESLSPVMEGSTPAEKLLAENTLYVANILNLGTMALREAGLQSGLSDENAAKYTDADLINMLAARFANTKKI